MDDQRADFQSRGGDALPPFRLERYFAEHEHSAPFLLCASDCESMSIADLLALEDGANTAFAQCWLGYTETTGDPDLRHDVADRYESIDADGVLIHAGGEEAIFTFMHGALDRGDHVIVQHPCYQSLRELPASIGCSVTLWECRREDGWRADVAELTRLLRPNTRALVVNFPHNPTGTTLTPEEWIRVIEIARRHGLVLFSDEAYRGLEYEAEARLPAACDCYERGVSLGLLSKGHGLPGLRVGWLASSDDHLLASIARFKDYTTICTSAPSEFLARIAVRNSAPLLERSRRLIAENLPRVLEVLDARDDLFAWARPAAGPMIYPTLATQAGDAEAFCARILDEAGVLLLPGTVFSRDSRELRIGFGRADLCEALTRFAAALPG